MSAEIRYDASDFWRLSDAFVRLPAEIRTKVTARAMARVGDMGTTRVGRRIAERVKLPVGIVRERMSTYVSSGDAIIRVKSNWISLYRLGARQTRTGVTVRARGSYRSAFIATMNGGTAVFKREGSSRFPVEALYGPNPANDIRTSPQVYQDLLIDIAEKTVLPRMLHELGRILPK
nr:phage tail protein [Mesorhizobium sp.]